LRRIGLGIVVALAATACQRPGQPVDPGAPGGLSVLASPTPFSQVSDGYVHALIPDDWDAVPAAGGFIASPTPRRWGRVAGSVEGLSVTWVDETQIGVPSDFYYLAATGPALSSLIDSTMCRPTHRTVYLDHRPSWAEGGSGSPGDFLAQGDGTCDVDGTATRWAYYVAAPGFGRMRTVGIPASGLYMVVAVVPDTHRARGVLRTLLSHARFGDAGISDFIAAAVKSA